MYSYSPIKKVFIKNFRNIEEATIDFEDSPIVSLIGENEQGKTSVVKAIAVCAMHATPRDQKDYIRDGTKGFGVAIELQDGTQVVRVKMAQANQYRVSYPIGANGEPIKPTWEASKIDSGLPKAVHDVMGMIEEPETKEFLHIRTYEDQLLFVTTASSTNYKVMYNALKISQLVDAIKLGQKEANQIKSSINQKEISADTLQSQISTLKTVDLEPIQNIRERVKTQKEQLKKLERAMEIKRVLKKQIENHGELAKLGELEEINLGVQMALHKASLTLEKEKQLKEVQRAYSPTECLREIDTVIESRLSVAISRKAQLDSNKDKLKQFDSLVGLEEIDTQAVVKARKAINAKEVMQVNMGQLKKLDLSNLDEIPDSCLTQVAKANKGLEILQSNKARETLKQQADGYCEQITNWFKAIGVNAETCPNCGETLIVNI